MKGIGGVSLSMVSLMAVGCGDITGATGAKGRVHYSLYTHYELEDWNLGEVSLVTGHPQRIQTEMTEKGLDHLTGDAENIVHTVVPAAGVAVSHEESTDDIADLTLTVSDPGDYTLESQLEGAVFDYLELSFGKPDEMEVITWTRNPSADDFEVNDDDIIEIEEGGQVTFLPIPRVDGARLAGDITVDITADPETAVTQGENIYGVYEQNVTSSDQPVSLYFVQPGTVSITLTDGPNGVTVSRVFEVEGVGSDD